MITNGNPYDARAPRLRGNGGATGFSTDSGESKEVHVQVKNEKLHSR
jgi:hypothetical protein